MVSRSRDGSVTQSNKDLATSSCFAQLTGHRLNLHILSILSLLLYFALPARRIALWRTDHVGEHAVTPLLPSQLEENKPSKEEAEAYTGSHDGAVYPLPQFQLHDAWSFSVQIAVSTRLASLLSGFISVEFRPEVKHRDGPQPGQAQAAHYEKPFGQ